MSCSVRLQPGAEDAGRSLCVSEAGPPGSWTAPVPRVDEEATSVPTMQAVGAIVHRLRVKAQAEPGVVGRRRGAESRVC